MVSKVITKKKSSLVVKFILGFVIIGIAICTVTTVRGYAQYKSYIQKQYNDTAYPFYLLMGENHIIHGKKKIRM